jgi:hypothetical protein
MPGNLEQVGDQNVIGGTGGGLTILKKDGGSVSAYNGRIPWRKIIHDK